jgi:predicted ATPase
VLQPPKLLERTEITMAYLDPEDTLLDLSSTGRGLQQTLLLLAHLYANPKTVLLLDEPDAHLEVLRQRQTCQLLTEVAARQGSQIIAASHSEIVLNEAANRDIVSCASASGKSPRHCRPSGVPTRGPLMSRQATIS